MSCQRDSYSCYIMSPSLNGTWQHKQEFYWSIKCKLYVYCSSLRPCLDKYSFIGCRDTFKKVQFMHSISLCRSRKGLLREKRRLFPNLELIPFLLPPPEISFVPSHTTVLPPKRSLFAKNAFFFLSPHCLSSRSPKNGGDSEATTGT